jgi:hypothetical protein
MLLLPEKVTAYTFLKLYIIFVPDGIYDALMTLGILTYPNGGFMVDALPCVNIHYGIGKQVFHS